MMSADGVKLKELLNGKTVLIVDDRLHTVIDYLEELEKNEIATEYLSTMEDALNSLKKSLPDHYGLALIDLHLPKIPYELRPYSRSLPSVLLNEGQLLALWLKKTGRNIPHAFLTAVPDSFKAANDLGTIQILDKNNVYPEDLPGELLKLLKLPLPPSPQPPTGIAP